MEYNENADLKLPIYLDYQSTTPMDKRVIEAMLPVLANDFGNPHSKSHSFGWKVEEYVENARAKVAKLINAEPKDIIFTSGATESNNTALEGVMRFNKNEKNHLITVATEHKCVLETAKYLKKEGFELTILGVGHDGLIDLKELENAITDKTALVSVMAVNNEIGVIQPLEEIGKICRKHGVYFHSDIAQAFGKIPIDVERMNIDLASISGHKIYGPKGVGALYIRRKPRVKMEPIIHGGGQERGFRSGTLPAPLIVGLGKAAEIAYNEMEADGKRMKKLFDKLYNGLSKIENTYLNGSKEHRYYGNLNMTFAGIEGESLMMSLKDIAVSSGSACTSSDLSPSYVIQALNGEPELAHSSIRMGFGRFTTEKEIDYVIKKFTEEVPKLREMSPLWEMMKEGVDLKKIKWKE